MAQRRLHGLQRVLGVNALFSTAYGNVGSSIYYALGLVASLALGLTPLVFVISGFLFFLTASTYAEATAMYPEAGGSSSFARRAFNELVAFFAAWGQMLTYTLTMATSAFFVPHYFGSVIGVEALRHSPADIVAGCAIVAVIAAVNIVGVKESTGINVTLAVTDFLTQLLLVLVGVFVLLSPHQLVANVQLGVAPTWSQFFVAIPLCMLAYTGIETISNMAEEAKNPSKTIPAAIKRVVIAVFAIYALLPAVALSALPVHQNASGKYETLLGLSEQQGGFAGDPVLGVVKQLGLGVLQRPAEIYVGLLAATILFIAVNAGTIGVSRLVYSMGMYRQVPDGLRRLHPRYGTPWIGIIVFSMLGCIVMLPGKADFLGNLYAFGAMLSFTIAHLSVLRLRFTHPEIERPYKGPGNIRLPGGQELPLFAIVGLTGTGLALVVLTVLHLSVAVVGLGWMAVGAISYPIYRRRHGLDLRTMTRVAVPQPVVDHEAEYESVLVALDGTEYSPEAMATAIKLAARRRRGIHVLVTITVPQSSPIDAEMPEQELAAQGVIEQAKLQGGRRVSGHWEKVRAGQAGRLIVREAREMRAQAVLMPLPRRGTSSSLFPKTVETVLAERPARVVLLSEPAGRKRPTTGAGLRPVPLPGVGGGP